MCSVLCNSVLHSVNPARGGRYLTRDDPSGFAAPPAFGPFRVLHQIGVGALGPVFRTYEPTRDRLVAVKVFRLDLTPEQSTALADELARAAETGLFHPSIVEPLAAGVEGTVAYRAEEYVAAESLDVALRHYAPAALDKVLPFITQLASAVDFARAAGVGHGALHPRDIFVTPDEARASGFGIVDALERLGLRAPVRRPYSSPERIAGAAWGTAADVFALGAIGFELLTGRRPSGLGDQMGALAGASLGGREEAVRSVLARAMAEDPAARYSSAGAFATALAEAAGVAVPAITSADISAPAAAPIAEAAAPSADVGSATAGESTQQQPQPDTAGQVAAAGFASLDDFASESTTPALGDSPREMARKVIAARKRQHKSKPAPERSVFDMPSDVPPLPAAEALAGDSITAARDDAPGEQSAAGITIADVGTAAVAAEQSDVPGSESDVAAIVDSAVRAGDDHGEGPEPLIASRDDQSLTASEPADSLPPLDAAQPAAASQNVALDEDEGSASSELEASAAPPRKTDQPIPDRDTFAPPSFEPSIKDDTAGEIEPDLATDYSVRELVTDALKADTSSSERVVAVDEFRVRDTAAGHHERARQRGLLDRGVPRVVPPPPTDSGVHEALSAEADTEPARERFAMLPVAIGVLIGSLIGFGGGYFVANRERDAPSVVENTRRMETAMPGTAAQAPSAGDTEQRVNPTTGSAPPVPADRPASASPASSTPPTSSAPAARSPKASAANAATAKAAATVKPAPKPPAAPAARTGQMVITSNPSRASVTVDGKWAGRTPLTLEKRRFGSYRIRVVQNGYDVASTTLTISAASPSATFAPTLTAKPSPPSPSAATKPAAAPAAAAKPAATAARPAAKTGEIFVDSRPQGATVLVDGKPVGVTPLRLPEQPAGPHTVRLELADHQPWTSTATVIGGQTARVTGSMERIR